MASILAAGTSVATSSSVVLGDGASATLAVYSAAGDPPKDAVVDVLISTTGGNVLVKTLRDGDFVTKVYGPGTYYAIRRTPGRDGTSVGVEQCA